VQEFEERTMRLRRTSLFQIITSTSLIDFNVGLRGTPARWIALVTGASSEIERGMAVVLSVPR
jgi:hypothetical protein